MTQPIKITLYRYRQLGTIQSQYPMRGMYINQRYSC